MRVLMVADRAFLSREHAMLRRLEVGLLDEGLRILRCVPTPCAGLMPSGLIPQAVYDDRGGRLLGAWRADRAVRELQAIDPNASRTSIDDGGVADIVHAWGEGCWDLASEIAISTEADLVLQTLSGRCLRQVASMERRYRDWFDDRHRALWAVPDEPMSRAVAKERARWPVRILPWGVFVPDDLAPTRLPHHAGGICVCGSGEDPGAMVEFLEGAADCLRTEPGATPDVSGILFVDENLVESTPKIWRIAEKLGLLDRLSVVADMESRREPILRAQALALPEATGRHRSITLDAMAAGMVVLAREDDLIEDLIDSQTAHLIRPPARHAWRDALTRVLTDSPWSTRLGQSARQHVATHRLASTQVAEALDLYRQLAGSPLEFKAP